MRTPMDAMEAFLESVRDTTNDILRDHRRWFADMGDCADDLPEPEEHYAEVNRQIRCLARRVSDYVASMK